MNSKEIINRAFDNYLNKVQVDPGLKALADIKVLIERFYEKEDIDEERLYLVSDIEEALQDLQEDNKSTKEIRRLIINYYTEIGRNEEEGFSERPSKETLIKEILNIVQKANVPANYEAVSRLRIE